MDDEFGPWIDHDFTGCPVKDGVILQLHVVEKNGTSVDLTGMIGRDIRRENWAMADMKSLVWLAITGQAIGITRYRIKKPKGMTIIDAILVNPEEKVKEDALFS